MFKLSLHSLSRFLTLAALFVFLYPPRFLIAGFFPRQELLFFCVVALAAICWAAARFLEGEKRAEASVALGHSWLDWGAAAFCLAALIATLSSSNIHVSFFGTIDRLTGFVTFAYIGALYVLIRLQFFDDRRRMQLLKAATLALLLQALYVAAQKLSIIDAQYSLHGRPIGAFTNPAIVAGYLVFGVFLPFVGYFMDSGSRVRDLFEKQAKRMMRVDELSISWKVIFFATALLSFFAITATLTRAAFIGVLFGGLVGALCIFFDRRFPIMVRRSAMVFLACVAILTSLVGIQIIFSPVASPTGIFKRLTDKSELLGGIQNRAISWSIAIEAAKERPIAGWGMDNFFEAFDKHFDTRLVRGTAEAWFDKAHNSFLEFLATAGILGLGAYVLLIGLIARAAFVMRKKSLAYAPLLALLGAYAANNIFIFDSLQALTMLFAVAAWIAPEYLHARALPKSAVFRVAGIALSILAVLLLGAGAVYAGVLPMRALGLHDVAWSNLNVLDIRAVEGYRQSISVTEPYARDIWQYLSQLILKNPGLIRGKDEKFFENITRFAFTEFADLAQSYRMSARDYYMAGRLGNFLGNKSDVDSQKILEYLTIGSSLAPDNPNFAYEFGQYYRDRGDHDTALRYLADAIKKDPNVPFTYANVGFTYLAKQDDRRALEAFERAFDLGYVGWKENPVYINTFIRLYTEPEFADKYSARLSEFYEAAKALDPSLHADPDTFKYVNEGFIYVEKRDFARAIESFENAFMHGYTGWKENPEYIHMFIQLYTIDEFVKDHLPRLAEFYEAAIVLDPAGVENYVQLAAIYKEIGNYSRARTMTEKAVSLDPSLRKEADMFIKSLPAR